MGTFISLSTFHCLLVITVRGTFYARNNGKIFTKNVIDSHV